MNKDSNILAEKYEAINEASPMGASAAIAAGKALGYDRPPSKLDKAKSLVSKTGVLAKQGFDAGKEKYKEMQAQSKESAQYKNRSKMYASEFLKGEQSYQDLNDRYGIDETEMYNLLKKARIPVTAFGIYRGKAGRGVDVYNDYINKYKPAPMQKLGRGIKSFANYFKGKKKPEA